MPAILFINVYGPRKIFSEISNLLQDYYASYSTLSAAIIQSMRWKFGKVLITQNRDILHQLLNNEYKHKTRLITVWLTGFCNCTYLVS